MVAKKHNKNKKQKPNDSKRGRGSFNVETASELDLESRVTDKKSSDQNDQYIPKE